MEIDKSFNGIAKKHKEKGQNFKNYCQISNMEHHTHK